jgi:hypothetical protein
MNQIPPFLLYPKFELTCNDYHYGPLISFVWTFVKSRF